MDDKGDSDKGDETFTAAIAESSESNQIFPERQTLTLRRSRFTRIASSAEVLDEQTEHSLAQLKIAQRLAHSLDKAFAELTEAFTRLTASPAIMADRKKIQAEFAKHEQYSEKMDTVAESLQRRIDELKEFLGIQSTPGNTLQQETSQNQFQMDPETQLDEQCLQNAAEEPSPTYSEATQQYSGPGADSYIDIAPGSSPGVPATSSPNPEVPQQAFPQPIYVARDPAASVPRFNGDPVRWDEFWHLFQYYVDSKPLEVTEKCRILKNALVGKAARPVYHLKICAENYELMKEIAQKEFQDNTQARRTHVRKIHDLCRSKDLHRDDKLLDFVTSLKQHMQSLVMLGFDYASLTATLSPTVLEALPRSYVKKFNAAWCEQLARGDHCELELLMNFLEREADLIKKCERLGRNYEGQSHQQNRRGQNSKNGHNSRPDEQKPEYNQRSQYSFAGAVGSVDHSCIFCAKDHASSKCSKRMSNEERRRTAESKNACLRCLRRNHSAQKCRARVPNCSVCNGRHSSLVCSRQREQRPADEVVVASPCLPLPSGDAAKSAFLQTGYVWVSAGKNRKTICRAILDPGSQVSIVSDRIVQLLRLSPVEQRLTSFHGVAGSVSDGQKLSLVEFKIRSRFSRAAISARCLAVPKVIEGILPRAVLSEPMPELADERLDSFPDEIDLLLGADVLPYVYRGTYKKMGSLLAQPTIFGWFLWGSDGLNQFGNSVVTSLGVIKSVRESSQSSSLTNKPKDSAESLEFLWENELLGIERAESDDDAASAEKMDSFFRQTVKRTEAGRYIVSLPFKANLNTLGDNQKLAYSRLIQFIKQATKSPKLLAAVDAEIKKYIDAGYAQIAPPRQPGEQAHYLPILAVAKKAFADSPEFKVRVVKDGGSRSMDEASLNDCMEQGPSLLPCIIKVLTNFRRKPIVLNTDIKAAFMQFLVTKPHRTYMRFYWPLGIAENPNAPIKEFWSTVLDFGIVAAPWLSCAGIRYHLDSEIASQPEHAPVLAEVRDSVYRDDVSVGSDSVAEAKKTVALLVDTFKRGHFPLAKWATNNEEVADFIAKFTNTPRADVMCGLTDIKFLGVPWDQVTDRLHIQPDAVKDALVSGPPTKRKLLKGLSALFDPLGIIAPIAINFKILCQAAWQAKLGWDTVWTGELVERYASAAANLDFVKNIRVERCLCNSRSPNTIRELHIFADASLAAYACCAYLREYAEGNPKSVSVRFLFAKARVAPLKDKHTIHRLELIAAVLSAKIARKLIDIIPEKLHRVHYYSDNSATLHWIRDPKPDRWKTFVANRVKQIRELSDPQDWFYVRTAENPADLASRGSALDKENLQQFWLRGPPWLEALEQPETHDLNKSDLNDCAAERKVDSIMSLVVKTSFRPLFWKDLSSWTKALRVTAYVLRFPDAARGRKHHSTTAISADELKTAESQLLKNIQSCHFQSELANQGEKIPRASPLHQLRLFVAEDGFLRCRSRMEKSPSMSFDEKFPILLPHDEHLVALLVHHIHASECLHTGGIANVLHHLRARFFVLRARALCRSVVHSCKTCVRYNARPASLPVPPLPSFRVEESAPFTATGIDFLGPIWIKRNEEKVKSYVLLFTCAVTRAIRLELVADMSAEEFLLALRRFLSRNPALQRLISDNARTFKRAERELDLLFKHARQAEVGDFLARRKITWQYGTEKAAWSNGFFERCVQMVKRPLRKVLGTLALRFRESETVLTEIEKVVNDRPISAIISDANEPRALSPANLLYGYNSQAGLPDSKQIIKEAEAATAIVFSERWRRQQATLRGFWKTFHVEYLQHLRSNHFATPARDRPLRAGDVCLLHSADSSRAYWPLCVVESLHGGEGTDRRHRSCWIRTAEGKRLRRPIQLLYPLEVRNY